MMTQRVSQKLPQLHCGVTKTKKSNKWMLGNIWHIVLALRPHVDPQFINVQPKDWGGIFPNILFGILCPKMKRAILWCLLIQRKWQASVVVWVSRLWISRSFFSHRTCLNKGKEMVTFQQINSNGRYFTFFSFIAWQLRMYFIVSVIAR